MSLGVFVSETDALDEFDRLAGQYVTSGNQDPFIEWWTAHVHTLFLTDGESGITIPPYRGDDDE